MHACVLCCFGRVWLFATLWTTPCQAPLSMGFTRQEYWSGLPFPSPGDLPDPGLEPASLTSPALAGGFFTTRAMWEAHILRYNMRNLSFWDLDFPGGNSGKEPSCQWRSLNRQGFYPWARKIPWRRKWQPTPVFLPGKVHGQRSLVGYSPWGHKEPDMPDAI